MQGHHSLYHVQRVGWVCSRADTCLLQRAGGRNFFSGTPVKRAASGLARAPGASRSLTLDAKMKVHCAILLRYPGLLSTWPSLIAAGGRKPRGDMAASLLARKVIIKYDQSMKGCCFSTRWVPSGGAGMVCKWCFFSQDLSPPLALGFGRPGGADTRARVGGLERCGAVRPT